MTPRLHFSRAVSHFSSNPILLKTPQVRFLPRHPHGGKVSYHALDSRTRKFLWAPDELGPPPVEADPELDNKTTP